MKKLFTVIIITLTLATSCEPAYQLETPEDAVQIRVECSPGYSTRNSVLTILKHGRARDMATQFFPSYAEIRASYYKTDNSKELITDIGNQLFAMQGVQQVDILDNASVIRQVR